MTDKIYIIDVAATTLKKLTKLFINVEYFPFNLPFLPPLFTILYSLQNLRPPYFLQVFQIKS